MKIKKAQSSWFKNNKYRLDCNPYISGSIEAKEKLQSLKCVKEPLKDLTLGLVNAGRIKRIWAEGNEHGRPFLSSTDILKTDLSNIKSISHKAVEENPKLIIKQGWSLITRAGSIGKMSYCRADMDGMACSEDVLRVIPDNNKVQPGYLYAYLSSNYGIPLIISGTYGAIIQHIEPVHIADLPVPRLGRIESKVHDLVSEAADLRVEASLKLSKVSSIFDQYLPKDIYAYPKVTSVGSEKIQSRFDAQYHDPEVGKIKESILSIDHISIGEWCSKVFLPGIFKRIHIDSLEHGAYYFTGAALFTLEPQPKGILSKQTSKFDEVYLEKGMILVQAFGQDGGLTGRSVWVGDHLDKQTTTHMLVRLQSDNLKKDAFLFGFLQSDLAYKQIACLTYGGSIPHFDEAGISTVLMPLFDEETFNQIAEDVLWAVDARDRALENEKLARQLVEEAIEEMVEN